MERFNAEEKKSLDIRQARRMVHDRSKSRRFVRRNGWGVWRGNGWGNKPDDELVNWERCYTPV